MKLFIDIQVSPLSPVLERDPEGRVLPASMPLAPYGNVRFEVETEHPERLLSAILQGVEEGVRPPRVWHRHTHADEPESTG